VVLGALQIVLVLDGDVQAGVRLHEEPQGFRELALPDECGTLVKWLLPGDGRDGPQMGIVELAETGITPWEFGEIMVISFLTGARAS